MSSTSYRVFVGSLTPESKLRPGSKGEGIYVFDLRKSSDGSFSFTHTETILGVNSSINLAITKNGKYLYATTLSGNLDATKLHGFRISGNAKIPSSRIGTWQVGTSNAVQATLDAHDRFLFVSSFGGNAATAFEIDQDTGELTMRNSHRFPNPNPGDLGPHYSVVDRKLRFVYFSGFSHDLIWRFDYSSKTGFDSKTLKTYPSPANAAVRSMALDPVNEKYLYVTCEHTNHLLVYKIDDNGDLEQFQYEPMPKAIGTKGSRSADIHVSPDGKFVYVSVRYGPNTIAVFQVQNDGKVKLAQEINSGGVAANYFNLVPQLNLVVVSNQDSDDVTAFSSNTDNGILTKVNNWTVNAPECLQVIESSDS